MKKETIVISILATILFSGCFKATSSTDSPIASFRSNPKKVDLLPALVDSRSVVRHKTYTLEYNEQYEQARWVAYMLTAAHTRGNVQRTDFFERDPMVATISAHYEDYRGSGYTRGHLCPAGDMKWDTTAMRESFYMSNICPQLADFNDGIWNKIEMQVRQWARDYDSVYIVTGPIVDEPAHTIGRNKVAVPDSFFKVVYAPNRQQAIAFLVPHRKSGKGPRNFVVSINDVESRSGIDFFPAMADDIEEQLESQCDASRWKWGNYDNINHTRK